MNAEMARLLSGLPDSETGLVMVLTDAESWGAPLVERSLAVLRSAHALGMPAAALVAAGLDGEVPASLSPAGRLLVAGSAELPGTVAAAVATA